MRLPFKFIPWVEDPNVLTVRFEELVGRKGGGSDELQLQKVKEIIDFIGINLEEKEVKLLASKIFSSKSSTFNKGQIGRWKSSYSSEHKDIVKKYLQQTLEDFGYEQNTNW
jgi:hypothetical protein